MYLYFCIIISVLSLAKGHRYCEKEEFSKFYENIENVLNSRNGVNEGLPLKDFMNDKKTVYECGEILLSKIKECDAKNETAWKEAEKQYIRDEYSLLVSWIVACDSAELWAGEKNGGTIASAIYHYCGGDVKDVIGPKNESDELTQIKYPE